jgi:hypothetical protein
VTGLALLIAVVIVTYMLISGSPHGPAASGGAPSAHRSTGLGRPSPTPSASPTSATPAPPPPAVQVLRPVRATAFGPGGPAHGDNPEHASLAIDPSGTSAWHTDWYSTASFGNLQSGTGLLLDMGHPVTITSARITFGHFPGADIQLRTGSSPALASLRPVATEAGAGGTQQLKPARPASGRYVLIWFTRLPQDSAGTFQASIYAVTLQGHP